MAFLGAHSKANAVSWNVSAAAYQGALLQWKIEKSLAANGPRGTTAV